MKNETTRTKTLSGFSSRAIALVLCFVMLLTAIGSGSVLSAIAADFEGNGAAVLVDAAKAGADVDAPAAGEAEESSDILAPEDIDDGFVLTKKGDAYIADTGRDADLAETGDTTYYLWLAKDGGGNVASNYTSNGAMTSNGDGSYTTSFTISNNSNFAFCVCTSNSDKTSGFVTFPTTSVSVSSDLNSVQYQYLTINNTQYSFLQTNFKNNSSSKTVYVTCNPTSKTMSVSTTAPSGGGSGSESGSSSGGQSIDDYTEADADWTKILNGTDVSFYITSYTDSDANATLVNSSGSEVTKTRHGRIESNWGKSYIQVAKSTLSTYNHISNNVGWSGVTVSAISSADGGESFKGDGSGASSATETTANTTGIKASYNKYENMTISTTANNTKTSFINSGSTGTYDLYIRYYLKYNNKFYYLEDLTHKATTSATVSTFDLVGLEPGSYKLVTAGVDSKDYVRYILDEDDFTITDISGTPTVQKSENKVIVNTSLSPSYIYQWAGSGNGTDYAVTDSSVSTYTYNTRKIYTRTSTANPGVILKSGTGWNNTKLSNNIGTGTTSGQTITEGNYYKKYDSIISDTTWDSFSHLSTELTINSSTAAYSMGTGDTVTITNTPSGTLTTTDATGESSVMAKYIYYVVDPDGNATKINDSFSASNTYDFTPTTAGTYKVFCYVQDMWGYETAISDNILTITVNPAYAVTVKSNNARLGTGTASPAIAYVGQTVTVTINENMGAIDTVAATSGSGNVTLSGSGSTRTFTMPASEVTVNLTFTDYTAASNFYYNSYETNGNESSTRYGQQMSEGKINGQKFSYYHVEGRTGNDQLFTVSYGNPAETGTIFFRTPESWTDKHGWDSGVQAQFFSSDDVQLKDWAWMTFDKDYGNGDKVYKISVPYGARKVQFRTQKNDPSTSNWPYTAICNLNDAKNSNDCFYIKSYSSSGNQTDIGTCNIGNQAHVIADGFWENFWGTNKYTDNFATKGFNDHGANHTGYHKYIKPKDLGTDSGDYYIIVLYENKTYTINGETHKVDKNPEIIWMPKLPGTEDIDSSEVNVYGKDGPIVIDWNNKAASGATGTSGTAYGYSLIADTKLYDSDGTTAIGTDVDDDGASYEKAKVVVTSEDSADIVIKTTINSSYTSKYYLKGWNINGVTYACGTNVKGVNAEGTGSNGVYTMTYTIPAGTEDSSSIEITPIYYLLSSYKTSNSITTVTFYLEGYNTITEKWGDTPYIYPFYGNLNNVDNSFGVYPGQPMVYANGQYSVEVPVNKNVPIAKEPGDTVVKGITINNGYADHVHRNLVYKWSDHDNDQEHKQTYDYDDFYKIYEECLKNGSEHPNSIIFRIQDEETVFNRSQYGGGKSGQFASGTSNISISDIATSGNGWELLVNRYDNAVNIFGSHTGISNPGSGVTATTDTSNALYVVSTGYNANIAGDYGTMWKIYNGSGELISNAGGRFGVPPSVLLLRGSSSGYSSAVDALNYPSANRSVDGVGSYTDSIDDYEAIYKALHNSSYTNKRVYITYEKDAQDTRKVTSGTGANRLDGRWYYTHKSDTVQSTIGIEYWDNTTATWVTDTMSGTTGSNTGCTAMFDNNSTTSPQYTIENNGTYSFSATATSGWQFDSWQIKYSETSYDQIATTASATMPATLSYNIVARFVPTTSGDLTINHTLNKASSGEGTVDMEVKVYSDSGKTVQVGETKTGSRVYLDGSVISNSTTASNYVIEITLKTTPIYDGVVSQFTYDKFNTDNSITATTDPVSLPGSENTLTTSTFTIPVSSLYNVGSLKTRELNYTSLIDETLHYYNFTYSFTDRSGDTTKTYTSKGVMGKTEYAKIVSDQANHTLDPGILVDKAPFESNFLKSNTLTKGGITYDSESHTYTATSTFSQSDNVPTYHVVFKLPYSYYNTAGTSDGINYKKYTASSTTYDDSAGTFDLAAKYNTFVTVNATSAAPDTDQTNVDKVTDGSDINHTGNDFITAPDELINGSTTMYFKYWDIKKLKSDVTAGDDVAKIYYPDFHYRVYSDYYVTAVYSSDATDSWKLNYSEENNTVIDCSVLYLGDSRNQWNNANKASSTDAADAADLIYSDFIFHYTYKGQEIKNNSGLEVGMILERATYKDTSDGNTVKWLTGSTSVNDMSYYRANYGGTGDKSTETARKEAILTALKDGAALPSGTIKAAWDKSELNNKNFTEQSYKAYSQYGQTVANDTITFAQDSVIDNYVYRAYAYIKGEDGSYTLSDPVYFSMRYTSNLKYTE